MYHSIESICVLIHLFQGTVNNLSQNLWLNSSLHSTHHFFLSLKWNMPGNKCHGRTTYLESLNEREKVIKNVLMEHMALKTGLKAGSISTRKDWEVGRMFHVEEMAWTQSSGIRLGRVQRKTDYPVRRSVHFTHWKTVRNQSVRVIQSRILKVWVSNLHLIWSTMGIIESTWGRELHN